jgi:hypothetical protein
VGNHFFLINTALAILVLIVVYRAIGDVRYLRGTMNRSRRWRSYARHIVVLLFLGALFAASWVNEAREASDAGYSSIAEYRSDLSAQRTSQQRVAAAQAKKDAEERARPVLERCGDDLDCVYEDARIDAQVYCRKQIERLAKFQSRWKTGLAAPMFTRIKWENQKEGVVTFIGDAIELQNGFGAWEPHIYSCTYNVRSKEVISVDAEPGRL